MTEEPEVIVVPITQVFRPMAWLWAGMGLAAFVAGFFNGLN